MDENSDCDNDTRCDKLYKLQCRCCQPINVTIVDKLTTWLTNFWVIIIIGLILFLIWMMILYYWRPSVVLDNALDEIDNARLILTAFIVAAIILIVVWGAARYILHKLHTKDDQSVKMAL